MFRTHDEAYAHARHLAEQAALDLSDDAETWTVEFRGDDILVVRPPEPPVDPDDQSVWDVWFEVVRSLPGTMAYAAIEHYADGSAWCHASRELCFPVS
jgi:hypothetical protein